MESLAMEYICGKDSYRQLAKKHGLPVRTVEKWGKSGQWVQKRMEYRSEARHSAENGPLRCLMESADQMCGTLGKLMADGEQFHLHLSERKEKVKTDQGESERRYVEQVRLEKADTKAMRDMVDVLKDLTAVVRDLYELPDLSLRYRMQKDEPTDSTVEIGLSPEISEFAQ